MHLPFYDAKSAAKVECQHALGRLKTAFIVDTDKKYSVQAGLQPGKISDKYRVSWAEAQPTMGVFYFVPP